MVFKLHLFRTLCIKSIRKGEKEGTRQGQNGIGKTKAPLLCDFWRDEINKSTKYESYIIINSYPNAKAVFSDDDFSAKALSQVRCVALADRVGQGLLLQG